MTQTPRHLTVTIDQLSSMEQPQLTHQVEIMGLEGGWYIVRFHRMADVVSLVDDSGNSLRFTGTQWISRLLRPHGFTVATLTWAEVGDEMIGTLQASVSPSARLENGVRVALQTD